MTDPHTSQPSEIRPMLLVHDPRNEYRVGQYIIDDGQPAVIRRIISDTGTVLRAEVEVYESRKARDEANR